MRAAQISSYGEPEVLVLVEAEPPTPAEGRSSSR